MNNLKEAKRKLRDDFLYLKKENLLLIRELGEYSSRLNLQDVVLMQGFTFKQCIAMLERMRDEVLTEENHDAIVFSQSLDNILSTSGIMARQIAHFKEARDAFRMYSSHN